VSLRILFADDSVTAQNMGKKILTEAGYEVVAVSNGAAAVKKIAEQKPDIIILDVYMPGYSGLEVCEKVRGSMETAKTPVLLTVGKMEPYKPEDGNRVKADGVIVKPFEASDLLAIVKRFEDRIRRMPAPVEQPVLMDRFEEQEEPAAAQTAEQPTASSSPQHTVEVPDHMATTSAFSDLLGAEPSHSAGDFQTAPPPPPPAHRAPAPPAAKYSPVADYEVPPNWRDRDEPEFEVPAPAVSTQGAAASEPELERKDTPVYPPPPAPRPLQIPVYREREQASNAYEIMPTATPPTGDIEIPREPELQESAAEATRNTIVDDIAPGLIPNLQEFLQQEAEQTSHAKPADELAPREGAAGDPVSDASFEARVAAAMSSYSRPLDAKPARSAGPVPAPTAAEVPEHWAVADKASAEFVPARGSQAVEYYPPARETAVSATGVGSRPAQPKTEIAAEEVPAPAFEYHPPVSAPMEVPASETPSKIAPFAGGVQPHNQPASAEEASGLGSEAVGTVSQVPWPEPGSLPGVGSSDNHVSAPSSIEASALAAAAVAGVEPGADPHTIAQAVHRVMERLKPELVDEIVRELKSKK
jgi:CheY-like chemotaxis protein